jgi:transcriptional regulator with XRE-family HTH domain
MPKTRGPKATDGQIGLRMRTMRIEKGLSQETLGTQLGVSFQQVQKYEKGTNRLSLSRAEEVAKALKTSVSELLGLDGGEITDTHFNYQTYQLAMEFRRLYELSPTTAQRFRNLIEGVCDDLEGRSKKKKR